MPVWIDVKGDVDVVLEPNINGTMMTFFQDTSAVNQSGKMGGLWFQYSSYMDAYDLHIFIDEIFADDIGEYFIRIDNHGMSFNPLVEPEKPRYGMNHLVAYADQYQSINEEDFRAIFINRLDEDLVHSRGDI